MKATEFCYWLQGYFELTGHVGALHADQVETIKRHLALVFAHDIDPSAGSPEHQATLNAIHGPGGAPGGGGPVRPGAIGGPPVVRC